jgi:hypothetical protein
MYKSVEPVPRANAGDATRDSRTIYDDRSGET